MKEFSTSHGTQNFDLPCEVGVGVYVIYSSLRAEKYSTGDRRPGKRLNTGYSSVKITKQLDDFDFSLETKKRQVLFATPGTKLW